MERARGRNRILISCPGSQLGKIVTVQDGPLGGESADAWASLLGPGRHAACKHSPQLIAALSRVLAGKPPTAVLQAQPPVRGREYSSRRPRDAVTAKSKQPRLGHGEKISGWCDKVDLGALSMQTGPEQALEAVPSGADDGNTAISVPPARGRLGTRTGGTRKGNGMSSGTRRRRSSSSRRESGRRLWRSHMIK
ncbi:uncharacterized protein LOC116945140 isoform X2 [Petromyzon marinus]|uniref:uncharacterized protein LOC116945140 isoform X2 n=1 Tax=Petromyzon marinus TaxID=7757 RepID=UPI003F71AE16